MVVFEYKERPLNVTSLAGHLWVGGSLFLYLFVDNVVTFQGLDEEAGLFFKNILTLKRSIVTNKHVKEEVLFFSNS